MNDHDRTDRPDRGTTAPAGGAVPLDVRGLNLLAALLWAGLAAGLVAAGTMALARSPAFALRAIRIDGDVTHSSVATFRANAVPHLSGSFYTVDLARARQAFEAVPWVRRAVVRRVWPNRLAVHIEEHRAVAYWQAANDAGDAGDKLVDSYGDVFEANPGDVEDEALPTLRGPDGQSAAMWAMWQRLEPVFAARGDHVDTLSLSGRGSWRLELDSGAPVELGRGSADEVIARTERFARTLDEVVAQYQHPLESADLRHAQGYAVRLRGITTVAPPPARAGAAPTPH